MGKYVQSRKPKSPPSHLRIAIDTREQLPYRFQDMQPIHVHKYTTKKIHIPEGDYSIEPFDVPGESIAIERKSLADLYGSMGGGRQRFEAEIVRLSAYEYPAIVIEAELSAIYAPNAHLDHPTEMKPKSVIASLTAWSVRYGIHIFCCPDRTFAEIVTFRLLERFYREHRMRIDGSHTTADEDTTGCGQLESAHYREEGDIAAPEIAAP